MEVFPEKNSAHYIEYISTLIVKRKNLERKRHISCQETTDDNINGIAELIFVTGRGGGGGGDWLRTPVNQSDISK